MKKKALLLVLGSAILMVGCGSAASAPASTTASVEEAPAEASADAETGNTADASQAATFIVEENSMGEELIPDEEGRVSNGIFSIKLPKEVEGKFLAYKYENNTINVYDKESHDGGFGGYAFGVAAAEDYAGYTEIGKKIGELTDANGKLYHIIMMGPSDVQYDFAAGNEMPENYALLYRGARGIVSNSLEAEDGGEYVDGAGTKGDEIYGEFVKELVTKIESAKDANELEEQELSPVYYAMTEENPARDPMKDIGVAYVDFNLDGVDEMVMGDINSGEIYDIYGDVDGKPTHVISGNWRDYYKVYGSVLAEYFPDGADVSVIHSYSLPANSSELYSQYALKLDETDKDAKKWFVSYDDLKTWESLDEANYDTYKSNIEYVGEDTPKLTFKALGEFK